MYTYYIHIVHDVQCTLRLKVHFKTQDSLNYFLFVHITPRVRVAKKLKNKKLTSTRLHVVARIVWKIKFLNMLFFYVVFHTIGGQNGKCGRVANSTRWIPSFFNFFFSFFDIFFFGSSEWTINHHIHTHIYFSFCNEIQKIIFLSHGPLL